MGQIVILISHRGNVSGSCPEENQPDQVSKILAMGFDVEIDLWKVGGQLLLGHDEGRYPVSLEFLQTPGLWIHAKNFAALEALQKTQANYFWHQEDNYTITSHGFVWCHAKNNNLSSAIWCLPSLESMDWNNLPLGVCSDKIELFKSHIKI